MQHSTKHVSQFLTVGQMESKKCEIHSEKEVDDLQIEVQTLI
jgi:hypothetical protein